MPRLPPALLRHAAVCNRHLPRLLRECRDLESATNELRWLAEYAHGGNHKLHHANPVAAADARLMHYVQRRSRGEPLQYILGTQPFGELDILCRANVLIPRPETELYTTMLAAALNRLRLDGVVDTHRPIAIADLCTGTGCIALLLHALLRPSQSDMQTFTALNVMGVDISTVALNLARQNLRHNLDQGVLHPSCVGEIDFEHLDVLDVGRKVRKSMALQADAVEASQLATISLLQQRRDVIISNPPYISPSDYAPGGTVSRSVRNYEPKLALVPPPLVNSSEVQDETQADQFYDAVLHIARKVQTNLVVMEIGDSQQAHRVRQLARNIMPNDALIETWRDDGSFHRSCTAAEHQKTDDEPYRPHERAIVVWSAGWAAWRLKSTDDR